MWYKKVPFQNLYEHQLSAGWTTVEGGGFWFTPSAYDGVKAIHWKEGFTDLPNGDEWYVQGRHRQFVSVSAFRKKIKTVNTAAVFCDITDQYLWVD